MSAGNVQRDLVRVADVLRERLARVSVKDDDARCALQADEQVVLAALVVVQPADHAAPREGDVGLARRLGEERLAPQLHQPAALVLETPERNAQDPFDHLLTPFRRTKSLTA